MHQNNEFAATLRIGRVVEFSPEKNAARVKFHDISDKISDFLPLLVTNSHDDKIEHYVDPDEHVICLMSGQGDEFGIILGSFYDSKNQPPFQTGNTHSVTYADGTMIQYDRASSVYLIHCTKDVEIESDRDINVKAGRDITVDAITRDIKVHAGRNIEVTADSHIQLTAPRIDLN